MANTRGEAAKSNMADNLRKGVFTVQYRADSSFTPLNE